MKTPICPLMQKECIEHECAFFTHIIGMHPQTGKDMDQWDCSIRWLPILITESARQTHNTCAAVESMRNEVVKRMDEQVITLPPAVMDKLLRSNREDTNVVTDAGGMYKLPTPDNDPS